MRRSFRGRTVAGHLSKGEDIGVAHLKDSDIEHVYEKIKIPYTVPESKHYYLTDVAVGPLGDIPKPINIHEIVIGHITYLLEFKGYPFTGADRKKYILVRDQNPEIDLRFVFHNAHRQMNKKYKTTYGQWATKHNFKWAHQVIPQEWLDEAKL